MAPRTPILLLSLALWAVAGSFAQDFFYPDRTRMAVDDFRPRGQPLFRVRAGQVLKIHKISPYGTHVFVAGPQSSRQRFGWVRFSPAELIEPQGSTPALPGEDLLSEGWKQLLDEAAQLQDDELKDKLREMNKNLWTEGYSRARDKMYSQVDNHGGFLTCVYTGLKFPAGRRPGSGPQGTKMNCEHSWPQSFFDKKEPMRSDMHHLFATEVRSNGTRGSLPFGDISEDDGRAVGSLGARVTRNFFMPPAAQKGDTARALLYFSVQHRRRLDAAYEKRLRAWHEQDPPDEAEKIRNGRIYQFQNSRNFFVDRPDLVAKISDF